MKIGKNKELLELEPGKIYIMKLKISDYKDYVEQVEEYLSDVEKVHGIVILPFFVRDVNESIQFEFKK